MGTVRQLKSAIRDDKELRQILVRSDRHEVLLDLDGDKIPDIGLLDVNRDGDIDAIGVDLTGNGEFNFYLVDNDGNGIADEISFYRDGDDLPVRSSFGRTVEAKLAKSAARIHALITAKELAAAELMDVLEALETYINEEYAKYKEENPDVEETADGVKDAGAEESATESKDAGAEEKKEEN